MKGVGMAPRNHESTMKQQGSGLIKKCSVGSFQIIILWNLDELPDPSIIQQGLLSN
jgi:hypothetical protein